MISEIAQWAILGLAACGYVALWRMDASVRSAKRIQQAARRNVAEQKRAVSQLKRYAADWGQLNQARAAINARYDETVSTIREKFGVD